VAVIYKKVTHMRINKIQAKSVLNKTGIPGAGYVINPYTGCIHGCVYCYARFMKRFTNHTERWGQFLDVKVNAREVLKRQLESRRKPLKKMVLLSSVTDPYLPEESRLQLTRGILEVLLEYQVSISILTKSDLVIRDIDLLRQFEECSVGLSLMTVDEALAHRFEPHAPSPRRRIEALRGLKAHNIHTYAFISPYLPRLSNIEKLMEALDGVIDEVGVEALNTKEAYWLGVQQVLAHSYPELLPGYRQFCKNDMYWTKVERRTRYLARNLGLTCMGIYRH
jgi:DNA repair photolyase